MRFVIIGLGSMGKRRIRNLQALKHKQIVGFDIQPERRREAEEKYGIKTSPTFEEALSQRPDAVIVSTPPNLHIRYAMEAARRNINFFLEASVLIDGMDELIAECKGKNIIAAASSTMRFHPSIQTMKRLVDENAIGKILAFNYHSGQYLPDWHPYEDYRKYYVSRKETGGCREIVPFELSWVTWLLGPVKKLSCMMGKLSRIEADIDDIYQMLLQFKNGAIGSMQVDVISRLPFRFFRMISDEGVITWDKNLRLVTVYKASTKKTEEYPEEEGVVVEGYFMEDNMYIKEMQHFIEAVEGKHEYMYSLEDDHRILKLLYGAETSSDSGVTVETN
ncbi:MAG: Gfo/Idh/MocA family oxidoreductase [Candidatus Bathyarchaeia archaeon]|jgi:predicted dehydrogenase